MSNRTLVELNHDFCPRGDDEVLADWARDFRQYMTSGNPKYLPAGVTFKLRRHHSDPDPFGGDMPEEKVNRGAKRQTEILDTAHAMFDRPPAADLDKAMRVAGECVELAQGYASDAGILDSDELTGRMAALIREAFPLGEWR